MSNRIIGARVKAAVRVHAAKQLRNLGFRFKDGANRATFKGDTAYAVWNYGAGDWVESFAVNYPSLPDNALISRPEADLIAAYTLHELGHVAFTDNHAVSSVSGVLFRLWNGIEDARIEHAVIASGKARGARSMFKKLMSKYTTTHMGDGFNPTSINSAPFALALICRAAYGDGNGFAKTLLDRIPAPHQSLYQTIAGLMPTLPLDRSGSAETLQLANLFLNSWLSLFPDALKQPEQGAQPKPQESQPQGGDSQEQDDDGDDFEPAPSGSRGQSDDDEDESDDEFSWGAGDDDLDDEGDEDGDDDSESLRNEADEAMESAPEQGDDSLFAAGDDDSDEEDAFADQSSFEPVVDDRWDESKSIAPEPNVDDVFKGAANRCRNPVNLPATAPAPRSVMSKWQSMAGKDETSARRAARALHKSALPALKSQLYRMLKAPEMCGWDGGALGGRFDGRRAPRMLAGSEQVFKRRWLSEGIDTAVSIVVDLSSSMSGTAIKSAVELAWTVAEACESARADVEVVGFADNNIDVSGSGYMLDGNYRWGSGAASAKLIVAKQFREKCAAVAHHFNALKRCVGGSTPDYSAAKSVVEQLSEMPHQRKVVIVITDGFGEYDGQEFLMKKLTRAAHELYGVDVIGFGINTCADLFARAYSIGCPVRLHDLHRSALKGVVQQLEKRDTRRVA